LTTFATGKTSPKAEKSEQSEPHKLEEERLWLIAEQKERQQALANRLIQDNERKKQRRQELALQAQREREAKELAECNFTPTVNKKFLC
jgi:uncharacterized membrane protein YccC